MNIETMSKDASTRLAHSINHSAGQHLRVMRNESSMESMESAAACHQIEMDKRSTLYEIGCKYGISDADSRRLCDVAGLSFDALMESTGA